MESLLRKKTFKKSGKASRPGIRSAVAINTTVAEDYQQDVRHGQTYFSPFQRFDACKAQASCQGVFDFVNLSICQSVPVHRFGRDDRA